MIDELETMARKITGFSNATPACSPTSGAQGSMPACLAMPQVP